MACGRQKPSLNVWKPGTSDERHVLFNTRDMPCLISLEAQHLVRVGSNSPLHRDRRTRTSSGPYLIRELLRYAVRFRIAAGAKAPCCKTGSCLKKLGCHFMAMAALLFRSYISRMLNSGGRPLNAPAVFIHPCRPIVAKQPQLDRQVHRKGYPHPSPCTVGQTLSITQPA